MTKTQIKWLIVTAVSSVLFLFLVIPLLSLVITSFNGLSVELLGRLVYLEGSLLWMDLKECSLRFYQELWSVSRYRQSLINSVGILPLLWVGIGLLKLSPLGKKSSVNRGLTWVGVVGSIFLTLGALAWPWIWERQDSGWWFMIAGATSFKGRLWQVFGYVPTVTFVTSGVGVLMAWILERKKVPAKLMLQSLLLLPLAIPPFLGALAYKILFGEAGVLTRTFELFHLPILWNFQGLSAALVVHVFLLFPLVTLTTQATLKYQDPSLREASRLVLKTGWWSWLKLELPLWIPGILAGSFIVLIRVFGDFATLSLLVPVQHSMMIMEAYRDLHGNTYWGGASMLSVLMIGLITAVLVFQKRYVETGQTQVVTGKIAKSMEEESSRRGWGWLAVASLIYLPSLLFALAIFMISCANGWGNTILPPSYGLERYGEIFETLFVWNSPIVRSFMLALPAIVMAVVFSFMIAYLSARLDKKIGGVLDTVSNFPFVIPGVAFAIAYIATFNGPPLAWHQTGLLVMIAYAVTRAPYCIRSTIASFEQMGPSLEESSSTLGGSLLWGLRRITFPLVFPGVVAGSLMVFVSIMQDVALTLMIAPVNWYPLSVFVFRRVEEGNLFEASAYGVILMLVIWLPYAISQFLGRK